MSLSISSCSHHSLTPPRARICAGGLVQYRRQCLDCRSAVGPAVAKAAALRETVGCPESFDEDLHAAGRQQAEAEAAARAQEREVWCARYNHYLESEAWRARRKNVLERAGGICKGCWKRRAVHSHHKTYDQVGRELLFELVSSCEDRHALAHENPRAEE